MNKRNGDAASKVASEVMSRRSQRSNRSAYSQSRASKVSSKYSEINENDEWVAIQKFNTLLHYEEQKQAQLREEERKKLIKQELDRQINAKKQREDALKEENDLYVKMYEEHGKILEQREKDKIESV